MPEISMKRTSGVKRIVVVGGGTAGWLAAWILGEKLSKRDEPAELVMIESSVIATIGVGEGTTALFRSFLEHFNLDEAEFLRETRATIKLGIRHRNWRSTTPFYDGPIDDPHWQKNVPGPHGADMLNVYAVAEGKRVSASHHFTHLMKENKVPFTANSDGTISRVSAFENAYHFDNAKVAAWLKKRSANLPIIDAVVEKVNLNQDGTAIESLSLDNQETLEGDLFIDCTGFKKLLVKALANDAWVSYKKQLPLNRAFAFQLLHEKDNAIASFTHAWAMDNGWMWQIPTQDRIGSGYAYYDEFCTPQKAQEEIEKKLKVAIEPLADIRFQVGRLERNWHGNCIAVGLSSGFLEPLEATSIHSTLIQLLLIDRDYSNDIFNMSDDKLSNYNKTIARVFDDFRTFLAVHYRGNRQDTEFWNFVKNDCLADDAKKRLETWSTKMPAKEDFDNFLNNLPHAETQLYYPVLDGLGLLNKEVARKQVAQLDLGRGLASCWRDKVAEAKGVASIAMSHRSFLQKVDDGATIVLPR